MVRLLVILEKWWNKMPWKSLSQKEWGHSPEGVRALGGIENVLEWDRATKGRFLPRYVKKSKSKSYRLLTHKLGEAMKTIEH